MELPESQTEDKSWQQSCNIFQQSEQQYLINSEFKQEQENKLWQKTCDVFDRECLQSTKIWENDFVVFGSKCTQNEKEDGFGTLIKQVAEDIESKQQNVQSFWEKSASPEKCLESKVLGKNLIYPDER